MKPAILIILDGFGIAPPGPGNAITLANPSNFKSYQYLYPNTTLRASGESVGLPDSEAGNTEVGHLNLGAGRVVYQDLPRINLSIADGSFYKNPAFVRAIEHIKKTGGDLHLIGLIGGGTVHSSIEHLYALLFLAKENEIKNVFIHAITDGRDSAPQSAIEIIARLEEKLIQLGIGKIASIMGRYYALDRDRRWERTEKAYICLTRGAETHDSPIEVIKNAYASHKTDEFISPVNISENNKPLSLIKKGDSVIFFNYRIDRPRQLTKAFTLDNFETEANKITSFDPYAVKYYKTHRPTQEFLNPPFKRGPKIEDLFFVTMTQYEDHFPVEAAYPPIVLQIPLGRVLSEEGIRQLRMAESEKERFVTFYFNGQQDAMFPQEERIIVPSPKVATYDLQPEMAAPELTEILIQKIKQNSYGFILVNFANPDMVGHTGNIDATIKAVNIVDSSLGLIVNAALQVGYTVFITADHGNAEQKINLKTGGISTEHTNNSVPFIAINEQFHGKGIKLQSGILADVAPTILASMGIQKPMEMTGRNLLEELGG